MKAYTLILAGVVACTAASPPGPSGPDAGPELWKSSLPLRGKRQIGCREHLLRLSVSMCDSSYTFIPAQDATPDDLWVAAIPWMPKDACLERWWRLARTCPAEVTP